MESTPSEDVITIVEMTTKDLEYYVNLIKQWQGLRWPIPILKEVDKILSNSREIVHERKYQSMQQISHGDLF